MGISSHDSPRQFIPALKVGDTVVVVPWGWTDVVVAVDSKTSEYQLSNGAWYEKRHLQGQEQAT